MSEGTGGLRLRTRMALLAAGALVALVGIGLLVRLAYVDVSTATKAVQNATLDQRDAAIDGLAGVARRMALSLVVAGAAALVAVGASVVLMRRWVLDPLDALREQLRDISRDGHRERVIVPSGPPELRAVGQDAESMRRALLAEADAARAADEGLAQEGPVVSAIRADLATVSDPIAVGLEVHGRVEAAHGVLAGDWCGRAPPRRRPDRAPPHRRRRARRARGAGPAAAALGHVGARCVRASTPARPSRVAPCSFTDAADGRFATALVAVVDPRAATVSWANAGHPSGWLLPQGDCDRRTTLEATGPLLSALGGAWTTRTAGFAPDDVVLAWSDGLVEARETDRETTDEDLARIVSGIGTREPGELVARVLAELRGQSPEWRRDDVTLVALRRVP